MTAFPIVTHLHAMPEGGTIQKNTGRIERWQASTSLSLARVWVA